MMAPQRREMPKPRGTKGIEKAIPFPEGKNLKAHGKMFFETNHKMSLLIDNSESSLCLDKIQR